ncbi:Alpha/beta hydrolase family protein [Rhodococcus erythropolis]|uniref:alpha/beta fold hydrolase n=1 Tax=Rhodococcus erythropolis TaxID=1833 RepID=UPI000876FA52|nr:alpha/beta hydrolase [Rhodococcus erythropolis]SCZ07964.1 Alpha/beta hydrolase family protein [Rhodococcus erythropolis]
MQTLTTQTISTPGTEMRVWRTPALDRKCVVFLHGAGVDHRMFDDQVAELAGAYSLVLPDLRGQGLSILEEGHRATLDTVIDDVKVMLDSLGIDRASIVGHSFGGNIAQEFTHRHADRVDKLVMIGSPGQHREMSGAAASAIKSARICIDGFRGVPLPFTVAGGRVEIPQLADTLQTACWPPDGRPGSIWEQAGSRHSARWIRHPERRPS